MKVALILVSFCYASAFGLHSKTSSPVQKQLGFAKQPAMVQPVDINGHRHSSTTVRLENLVSKHLIAAGMPTSVLGYAGTCDK